MKVLAVILLAILVSYSYFHSNLSNAVGFQAGYFDIACRRIEKAYSQPDLFIEAVKHAPAEQLELLRAAE